MILNIYVTDLTDLKKECMDQKMEYVMLKRQQLLIEEDFEDRGQRNEGTKSMLSLIRRIRMPKQTSPAERKSRGHDLEGMLSNTSHSETCSQKYFNRGV